MFYKSTTVFFQCKINLESEDVVLIKSYLLGCENTNKMSSRLVFTDFFIIRGVEAIAKAQEPSIDQIFEYIAAMDTNVSIFSVSPGPHKEYVVGPQSYFGCHGVMSCGLGFCH